MDWSCNYDDEIRNAYRILVAKSLEKCPLGKLRRTWEDNI
jgi:hypothetical protein